MLPQCSHKRSHIGSHKSSEHDGSHITKKRGVYYYRRRLPSPRGGEVAVSLRTRNYREAEHRAADMDDAFNKLITTMDTATKTADLQAIIREYLKETLRQDFELHLRAKPGEPVYRSGDIGYEDPVDADLELISNLIDDAKEALARRDLTSVADTVEALVAKYGLAGGSTPAARTGRAARERQGIGDIPAACSR
jgi:hypothetical protein